MGASKGLAKVTAEETRFPPESARLSPTLRSKRTPKAFAAILFN
jgi:hypothetical protein